MKKKYVVVLGAGISGVGSAILAKKKGYDVLVSDINKINKEVKKTFIKHSIDFEEGRHSEFNKNYTDFIIKSPGISNESTFAANKASFFALSKLALSSAAFTA